MINDFSLSTKFLQRIFQYVHNFAHVLLGEGGVGAKILTYFEANCTLSLTAEKVPSMQAYSNYRNYAKNSISIKMGGLKKSPKPVPSSRMHMLVRCITKGFTITNI